VVNLDPNDPIEVSYEANFEGEPTGIDNPELLSMKWHHGHNNSIVNGIGRIGYMKGGRSALWSDIDMADHFLEKALQFVEGQAEPFFLYYALQQPHVPRTPHPRFEGATTLGPRGDVIVEADWCIGQLVEALEKSGKLENTLIIVSSDNGPVLNDGYYDSAAELNGRHTPWGPFRGGKYSLYEAGTRVPFISYWKGNIAPGTSDALLSQLDIYSSLAELTGSSRRGPDSEALLGVILGESNQGREELVVEAIGRTAFRVNDWKYIPPYEGNAVIRNVNIETGASPEPQLYNLSSDLSEKTDLSGKVPATLDSVS
jgi:arylsulfatase A-like enzyme